MAKIGALNRKLLHYAPKCCIIELGEVSPKETEMKLARVLIVNLLLFVGMLFSPATSMAETPLPYCAYFAETKHNVHGAFLLYYNRRGDYLGLPLTEAFWEKGRIVQYFERARLEFVPENPSPHRVEIGMLGLEQYPDKTDPPIRVIPPANDPNFAYFQESGQMTSFAFKDYFDKHGGREVFGYPISWVRYETGKFVQYFQRQLLVWDPLAPESRQVTPTLLGKLALEKNYPADFKWRAPAQNDWCGTPPKIGPTPTTPPFVIPTPGVNNLALTLQVRVRFRQTGTTGPQYVDVIVEDQAGRRLGDIAAYAVVHLADGRRHLPLLPTNNQGMTTFGFEIGKQPPNCSVLVEVMAFSGPVSATGRDTFTCQ